MLLADVSGRLLGGHLFGGRFAVKLQNRMIWNILKRYFFGSTKFDEFRFLKIIFENFESEISKIFETVLFYLAFY